MAKQHSFCGIYTWDIYNRRSTGDRIETYKLLTGNMINRWL